MFKNLLLTLFFGFVNANLWSENVTISGTITDSETGEQLISANIYVPGTGKGTTSNYYGFYSLKVDQGDVNIVISYVGYISKELSINLTRDTIMNISLVPFSQATEEVTVTLKGPEAMVHSTQMSRMALPVKKAKELPVLLGEADIIKSLQLLPGIHVGTEGSSGIYVRGGGPDQNLFLLDGVPVYNIYHLFGFFSVINPDAIKSVNLSKGGFTARYGGRLSSVVDIRMKEGNNKEFKGEASIGLISSKLTLEGPIIKDKTSFLISARRTYADLLMAPVQKRMNKQDDSGDLTTLYFYYDLNAKLNHIISKRDRLYLSAYMGNDNLYFKEKFSHTDAENYMSENKVGIKWGNITSTLRWNHIFSNELFGNVTLVFSNFKFQNYFDRYLYNNQDRSDEVEDYSFDHYSQIKDYGLKWDFDLVLSPGHYLRFGANNTVHFFSPIVMFDYYNKNELASRIDLTYGQSDIMSQEFSAYLEDEFALGARFKMNAGMHYSNFKAGMKLYHSLQPRISGRYLLGKNLSVKASYAGMTQYLNLLANSLIGMPSDLWVPATEKIKPQNAWQTAVGTALAVNNNYEFTIEAFYKEMENLIEYREGEGFFNLQTDWESKITQGNGTSYGTEVFLQKSRGKITGWMGYTLSRSLRQFDEINQGEEFPYKYDRRHDLSIVLQYKPGRKFDMGVVWVYSTGNAFTLADEKFVSNEWVEKQQNGSLNGGDSSGYISYFEHRNAYRMPDYHRLDVGLNFHKQRKRYHRTFSLGVYNSYGHQNPLLVYQSEDFNEDSGEWEPVLKQISIFSYIPYIRWGFKF